jgi:putative molybdopterin biosynthesis protein
MSTHLITLHTVDEVAHELRVSRDTVYRLVRAGKIGAHRIGGQVRIPAEAVDAYVRRRKTGQDDERSVVEKYFPRGH